MLPDCLRNIQSASLSTFLQEYDTVYNVSLHLAPEVMLKLSLMSNLTYLT